ncbi:hypothetical protein [Bradyrhizobium sp. RP6]|uniref:hypothetical protein n=1 Tax=Bradyrhizobium sp. RP6 TaxID=2489596 RepID=UPI000F527427|nr:hypothetical protein [Bradyrhizobium sp. RP6]RQH14941.1 hypothetical protein EHH60_07115 [Bradyrhizobium sp. RP6]
MPTVVLPEVTIVNAAERVVAIGLKVWDQECKVMIESDDAVRFAERVRGLRKRSMARLTYLDTHDDDVKAYVEVKHSSSGYIFCVDLIRAEIAGDEVIGDKAQRSMLLSDEQMFEFLADLEFAGGVTASSVSTASFNAKTTKPLRAATASDLSETLKQTVELFRSN